MIMSKLTCVHLDGEQAVRLIDRLLAQSQHQKLNDLQSTIVLGIWMGSTYRSIADRTSYDLDYIKQIAARLWKLLSQLLAENICKNNIKSVLDRCQNSIKLSEREPQANSNQIDLQTIDTWIISDKVAVFSSLDHHQNSKSLKLDLQVQNEIESLIWQNLDKPANPNIFINKILTALTLESPVQNSVNCLVLNCYFDRLGSSTISILLS